MNRLEFTYHFSYNDQIVDLLDALTELGRMDEAIEFSVVIKKGKDDLKGVGRIAFWSGFTGGILALILQYYLMVIAYPVNVGGKPSFAVLSFIPIMFELTVLFAVFGMFFRLISFRMDNKHQTYSTVEINLNNKTLDLFKVSLEFIPNDTWTIKNI